MKKTNKAYKKIVLAYSGGLDTSIIIVPVWIVWNSAIRVSNHVICV